MKRFKTNNYRSNIKVYALKLPNIKNAIATNNQFTGCRKIKFVDFRKARMDEGCEYSNNSISRMIYSKNKPTRYIRALDLKYNIIGDAYSLRAYDVRSIVPISYYKKRVVDDYEKI